MLSKTIQFVKKYSNNIFLFLLIFLLCLLSFGVGYLTHFYLEKPLLEITDENIEE